MATKKIDKRGVASPPKPKRERYDRVPMRSGALLLQDVFQEAYLSPSEVESRLAFALNVFKSRKPIEPYTKVLNRRKGEYCDAEDKPQSDNFRRWQRKLRQEGASKSLYARAGILFAQVLWMQAINPNPRLREAAKESGCNLNEMRWEILHVALYAAAMACEARLHADAHAALSGKKYDPEKFGEARKQARENLSIIFEVTGDESGLPEALVAFLATRAKIPSVPQHRKDEIVLDKATIVEAMINARKTAQILGAYDWREFYSDMIDAEAEGQE